MSGLVRRVVSRLYERRDKILGGEVNCIPLPFSKMSDSWPGIEQAKYYGITAAPKAGKTQIASFLFIYTPILYAYYNPEKIRVKVFYYPLEETPEIVLQKFMCYLLYTLSKGRIRISPLDLTSTNKDKPLSQDILDLFETEEYKNILEFFEKNVIFMESKNPTGVNRDMKRYATENGVVHTKPQLIKDKDGETKEIQIFSHYEQNDRNEYRIIFIDHISLIGVEQGMDLRASIGKLSSEYLVSLRNKWNFIPVVVQQQNLMGESLDNFKNNKLRPSLSDLADNKATSRDMNMLIGIFSPYKHELRTYLNYDITKLKDQVRFVEIMINRDGQANDVAALYFDGAVNFFKEMPQSSDSSALEGMYRLIENNKRRSIVLTMLSMNNLKHKKSVWINLLKRFITRLLR